MRPAWTIGALVVVAAGCGGDGGGGGGGGATPLASPIGYAPTVTTLVPGSHPLTAAAAGFFDGDPWPDLAVGHGDDGSVSILLGRGDGTFDPAAPITAGLPGTEATWVRAAFLDLDPFVDLVVVDDDHAKAQTYLGQGDGTFDPVFAVPLDLSPSDTFDVQVGRLNGDVLDDVVVVTPSGVYVYLAVGNGFLSVTPASPYLPAASIEAVHIGQVEFPSPAGNPLDLILCSPSAGLVYVLQGDGLGGFAASPASPVAVPEGPLSAVLASIDGQSTADLVVLTAPPTGARIFLGDGGNNFVPTTAGHIGIVGDFGLDTAVVTHYPSSPYDDVLLLTADATLVGHVTRLRPHDDLSGEVVRTSVTLSGGIANSMTVFDMDQDGLDDLILPYLFPATSLLEVRLGQ